MVTQKNRLNKTVLLSTQTFAKKLWVRKYLQFYAEKFCLSEPVYSYNCTSVLYSIPDAGQFNNNPGTVTVHENQDDVYPVWSNIDATCYVRSTCSAYRIEYYQTFSYSYGMNTRAR